MTPPPVLCRFSIKTTARNKVLTCSVATGNGGTLPLAMEKARLSVFLPREVVSGGNFGVEKPAWSR